VWGLGQIPWWNTQPLVCCRLCRLASTPPLPENPAPPHDSKRTDNSALHHGARRRGAWAFELALSSCVRGLPPPTTHRADGASASSTFSLGPRPLFKTAPFRLSIAKAAEEARL
jgi:hypothetical protein